MLVTNNEPRTGDEVDIMQEYLLKLQFPDTIFRIEYPFVGDNGPIKN